MEFHELANIFPMMTDDEMASLVESVKQGYDSKFPIITFEGKILDGRNRYVACTFAGVEPVYSEWEGGDPVSFVVRANLERRHLSSSQKAMIALEVESALAERGKKNMSLGGQNKGLEIIPNPEPVRSAEQAAKLTGTNARYVTDAKAIQEKAPELADKIRSGEISIPEAKAEIKKQERTAYIEKQREDIASGKAILPTGTYEVIALDPPWAYGTEYDPNGRRAANPYPEMSLGEIGNLDLPTSDDCVLWLWTTHKFMRYSFDLLDKWGFRDVAILTWIKDRMGLGSWLRSQSEFCIMAVKGKPLINLTNQTTVIHGRMREHSRKPDEFYTMVNELCVGRKLDYFAREGRDGWDCFGNDTRKFEQLGR